MAGFLKRLFESSESKARNQSRSLAALAQVVVAMTIATHLKAAGASASNDEYRIAAAWANYLFGWAPSESHADLDLEAEHGKALLWMEGAGNSCAELIIQGLRITSIVNSASNKTASLVGTELLEKFGDRHPDGPDLDRYSVQLLALMKGLEAEQMKSVRGFIEGGPFAREFKNSKYFGGKSLER